MDVFLELNNLSNYDFEMKHNGRRLKFVEAFLDGGSVRIRMNRKDTNSNFAVTLNKFINMISMSEFTNVKSNWSLVMSNDEGSVKRIKLTF